MMARSYRCFVLFCFVLFCFVLCLFVFGEIKAKGRPLIELVVHIRWACGAKKKRKRERRIRAVDTCGKGGAKSRGESGVRDTEQMPTHKLVRCPAVPWRHARCPAEDSDVAKVKTSLSLHVFPTQKGGESRALFSCDSIRVKEWRGVNT